MRSGSASLAALALVAAAGGAMAEPSLSILSLPFAASEFRGPSSRVAATIASTDAFRELRPPLAGPIVVVWGAGGAAALTVSGGAVVVRPAGRMSGDLAALERGRGAIPGARLSAAGGLSVTLEDPSRDYAHDALGSQVHAGTLAITERKPAPPTSEPRPVASDVARIAAGPGGVFEDREPRIVDLDGDGSPEILVVRSRQDVGSSLAVIGRRDGAWAVLAETPPDGEPFRWLNVAAIVRSGRSATIALVRRPHLDGVLQVWRYEGGALALAAEMAGYSNHAFGSPATDLAALVEEEGGGAPRLAVPTLDRRSLAILSLGPPVREIARIPLPARAATGIAVLGRGRDSHILVGLEDGRVADLRP